LRVKSNKRYTMKRIFTIVAAMLILSAVSGQDRAAGNERTGDPGQVRTIFRPGTGHGGYAGLSFGYTEIGGRNAVIVGARGSWIIGHSFGLGMGGYGFINDPVYDPADDLYYNLTGGYGGIVLEPIVAPRWPVHLSFPVTLGAGALARTSFTEIYNMEPYDVVLEESSIFLVAEPGAELEFNLTRWLRMAAYGSYRFTTNINMVDVAPDAMRHWNAGVSIKVGGF